MSGVPKVSLVLFWLSVGFLGMFFLILRISGVPKAKRVLGSILPEFGSSGLRYFLLWIKGVPNVYLVQFWLVLGF